MTMLVTDRVGPTGLLSKEEIEQINAGLSHYDDNQALSIDALKIVQKHRGWVSDECLQAIADYLKISTTDLEAVATFYNLIYRQPVGKHVIRICDSVSCWIMGYEKIRDKLRSELGVEYGQTTSDNQFTLLPGPCMGACDKAPVLMVDHDLITNIDADDAGEVLRQYQQDKS